MTGFPLTSWSSVQMWARAIAPCAASQIQGFEIIRNQLAGHLARAQVSEDVLRSVQSGSPAEVSAALIDLKNSPALNSERSVTWRLAAHLRSEAMRLDDAFQRPPLSRLIHSRRKVAFELGLKLLPDVAGSSEMDRGFIAQKRATLAANEAVPFVARCLSTRALDQLRADVSSAVPAERAPDVIVAAEIYLKILGL